MDETNVYRWGRLILEKCILWLGDHKGTFVLLHFYLILPYCVIFYLWHSNQNLIEGKHILFGPESRYLKWKKNLHFSTLSSQRLLFAVTSWLSSAGILSWGVPDTPRTIWGPYLSGVTDTSLSHTLTLSCLCNKMKFCCCPRFILVHFNQKCVWNPKHTNVIFNTQITPMFIYFLWSLTFFFFNFKNICPHCSFTLIRKSNYKDRKNI